MFYEDRSKYLIFNTEKLTVTHQNSSHLILIIWLKCLQPFKQVEHNNKTRFKGTVSVISTEPTIYICKDASLERYP